MLSMMRHEKNAIHFVTPFGSTSSETEIECKRQALHSVYIETRHGTVSKQELPDERNESLEQTGGLWSSPRFEHPTIRARSDGRPTETQIVSRVFRLRPRT